MSIEEMRDLLAKLLWDIPTIQSDESCKSIIDEMRRRNVDLGSHMLDGRLQCIEIVSRGWSPAVEATARSGA
jgi:hypothetical protein